MALSKEIGTIFFDFVKEEMESGRTYVIKKCKLCQKEYRGCGSSSHNYIIHFKFMHKKEFAEYVKSMLEDRTLKTKIVGRVSQRFSQGQMRKPRIPEQVSEQKMQPAKPQSLTLSLDIKRKMLKFEKMLIASGLSLDIVNNSEFKEFIHDLDPKFQLPQTETLVRDVNKHYKSTAIAMRKLLKEANVIITSFDLWITKSMVTYLCVNAHFVTKSWNYEHKLLAFKRIFGIANKATIMSEYELILHKFAINDIVFLNVASNTSNLMKALQFKFSNEVDELKVKSSTFDDDYIFDEFLDLKDHLNFECCKTNIINRNECFILKLLHIIYVSIQNAPGLIETLHICGEILSYIRLSDSAIELKGLLQQCLDARRISAIHMFQSFFEVYKEISTILKENGDESWLLNPPQLEILQEFIEVLQPFQEAIDFIFNDSRASISKCLPTTIALRRHLDLLVPIHLQPLIQALITNLEKRLEELYEDPVYLISTILHPAWKLTPFIHADRQVKAKQILIQELSKIPEEISLSKAIKVDSSEPCPKTSRLSLMFQSFRSHQRVLPCYESELECYLSDIKIEQDANPLDFWRSNEAKYPCLSPLSKKYLAIPAISMPIGKIQKLSDDIIEDRTNVVTGDSFSKSAVLKYNLDLI